MPVGTLDTSKAAEISAIPLSVRLRERGRLRTLPKAWEYVRAVEVDYLLLVGLPGMDIDDRCAAIEQFLHLLQVNG
jgi:hypothetical protein